MNKQEIIASIDRAIRKIDSAAETISYHPSEVSAGHYKIDQTLYQLAYTTAVNTTKRLSPPSLAYISELPKKENDSFKFRKVLERLKGSLLALKADYEDDCMTTFEELVHAELFTDILDQAGHLLDNGYKDAAAVTIGCTLESHLKALCTKNGINLAKDNGKLKKASELNTDLRSAHVYSMSQDRQVQTWLDIRNDAAHGEYEKVEKDRVKAMLAELRNFLVRYPA